MMIIDMGTVYPARRDRPPTARFRQDRPMLRVDSPSKAVRVLTLDRPDALNAMNGELCQALHEELDRIAADRACRAVVLTGAGRAFCVGLDLQGYGESPDNDGTDDARDRLGRQEHMSRLVLKLRETPQPVIAAVNGPAAGFGLALALGSDIRYAADSAVFRAIFINIGVSNCDMGTSWLLPRLVGASRAHELMLTGRRVSAEEAARIGLVADVTAGDALLDRALESAEQIAAWTPWGIRLTKQGMWSALETPSLRTAIEYEDRQQIMATFGVAVPEAVTAFLEKRPAEFPD
jgi:enoyl-CoA hydratase